MFNFCTYFIHVKVSGVHSLWPHGPYSPWNSPGQNTGVGSLSLLQGFFPTQRSNPGLPRCGRILYQLNHKEISRILDWVAYPFSSGSSQTRNLTGVSCIAGGFFTNWAIREAHWWIYNNLINATDGLMLKLKLQYFGHLIWRTDSLEKILMLGKIEGRRRRGWQRMRSLDGITDSMDMSLFEQVPWVSDVQGSLACCSPWDCRESDMTEWLNSTELMLHNIYISFSFFFFLPTVNYNAFFFLYFLKTFFWSISWLKCCICFC